MQRIHAEDMLEAMSISAYPHLEAEARRQMSQRYYSTVVALGPEQELDKAGLDALRGRFGSPKKRK